MKCENCSSKHDGSYGSGRFCSEKCARGFATKANREEISRKVSKALGGKNYKRKEESCLWCGGLLGYRAKKFCSAQCCSDYRHASYINKWKLGVVSGLKSNNYSVSCYIRTYLRNKYNNSCAEWLE